ncbi:unnamed protein product [Oppiella nova]|uniref:Protein kinase domain-containing protein n=1 Tax=Oppiella nova TaxID=334625 RepID=A0A7R9LN51_9ACAR|nr:unnamed protein product [Oppiella nova]CAG2165294.1 unnamed protein product [Oppiella nova]
MNLAMVRSACFNRHSNGDINISIQRCLAECRKMATLNHRNIIQYKQSGQINNQYLYIKMNLCQTNLREIINLKIELIQKYPDNPDIRAFDYVVSCKIFKEILDGLHYLHTRPQPSNPYRMSEISEIFAIEPTKQPLDAIIPNRTYIALDKF